MEILRLEDVHCVYGKNTPFEIAALDGVTVGFEQGKVVSINLFDSVNNNKTLDPELVRLARVLA